MQFGINLLPTQKVPSEWQEQFQRFKILVAVVLLLYIIFVVGLLAYSFSLSSSQKKLVQEKQAIEKKVKSLEKKEILFLTFKQRLEFATEILAQREKIREAQASQEQLLTWVSSLVLPGISLKEIEIKEGQIAFGGEAQNALALGDFLDQFSPLEKKLSYLSLNSLNRSVKGIYTFSFQANLF